MHMSRGNKKGGICVDGYIRFRHLSVWTLESNVLMRAAFFLFLFPVLAFMWNFAALREAVENDDLWDTRNA